MSIRYGSPVRIMFFSIGCVNSEDESWSLTSADYRVEDICAHARDKKDKCTRAIGEPARGGSSRSSA